MLPYHSEFAMVPFLYTIAGINIHYFLECYFLHPHGLKFRSILDTLVCLKNKLTAVFCFIIRSNSVVVV